MLSEGRQRLRGRLRGWRESRPQVLESPPPQVLAYASDTDRAIVEQARAYSMTSPERLLAVVDATRYCLDRGVPGAMAECGVWRGGSALAVILALQDLGDTERDIYLYDTFEGMTKPTELDVSTQEGSALTTWREATRHGRRPWEEMFGTHAFNEAQVRTLLESTGYPSERLHFVRGRVEETIPEHMPEKLALLRLDTDWYESTRHELTHMFPVLSAGGVLIIDDYGHWEGARRAVDEYFGVSHPPLLLHRIDYTGRIAIKA